MYTRAAASSSSSSSSTAVESFSLNYRDRPQSLQEQIKKAWQALQEGSNRDWHYAGSEGQPYCLAGVDEHALVKALIKEAPDRKKFYVLDIGAGDFSFGKGLVAAINRDESIAKDVEVHIIGVRGEPNLLNEVSKAHKQDKCYIYELGSFQIENLLEEFTKQGLELDGNVDLIVSRWTFRHLVDPVGTFLQTYSLLRPGSGLLLMDGFFYNLGNDNSDACQKMYRLLINTKVPFLLRKYDLGNSLDQFILKRTDAVSLSLPLMYEEVQTGCGQRRQIASDCITCFNVLPGYQNRLLEYPHRNTSFQLMGDADLYWLLSDAAVFGDKMSLHDEESGIERVISLGQKNFNLDKMEFELGGIKIAELKNAEEMQAVYRQLVQMYCSLSEKRYEFIRRIFYGEKNKRPPRFLTIYNRLWTVSEALMRTAKSLLEQLEEKADEAIHSKLLTIMREFINQLKDNGNLAENTYRSVIQKSYHKGFLNKPIVPSQLLDDLCKSDNMCYGYVNDSKDEAEEKSKLVIVKFK